jgi:hypothetical protein
MDSISTSDLTKHLKAPTRPILIDVRRDDAYHQSSGIIPGAVRCGATPMP